MGVFKYLITHGTCADRSYPYTGHDGTPKKKLPTPYRAVSWGYANPTSYATPSVKDIKTKLLQHGPIAVTVNATDAFEAYTGGVFNEFAPGDINHAVVLIGWDDTKGKKGAWLMKNSWSTGWGDHGFMWIEYGSNAIGSFAAWVEAKNAKVSLPAHFFQQMVGIQPHFSRIE
jgi:cathepsin L